MGDIVLSIDIGTSKVCALAWDAANQRVLAVSSAENGADIAQPGAAGGHEQDPTRILERCLDVAATVAASPHVDAARVSGIGFSGQMHGVLLADDSGAPVTPFYTWRDARVAEDDPILSHGDPAANGCGLHPGYGGVTLAWLARNGQTHPSATALSIAGFVAARVGGAAAIDPTHAASWGILDLRTGDWNTNQTTALGITPANLPPLTDCARPLGQLNADVASRLGLRPDVQVCAPLGDNQASFIGVAGLGGKAAVLNLGTGGQLSVPTGSFAPRSGLETRPLPFGGYLLVGASLCGGWSYAYLCDFFRDTVHALTGNTPTREDVYARMNAWAGSETETGGLRCDTRFLGVRGVPGQRGAIHGINTVNLTPAKLTRAVLEGMVNELLDMMPREALGCLDSILATGNAVRRNPVMQSLIESLSGKPCALAETQEEAAAGAAIATAFGLSRRPLEA